VTSADRVAEPVTVVVARAVTEGQEHEFRQWAQRLTEAAEEFPGFLGWGLLHPASGSALCVAVRRLDGMDAWFAPTPAPGAPPRWKTFLMTATVIVVLQTLLSTLLRPLVADWPTVARSVAIIVPVVALMTWVVMPQLSGRLRPWLYRS
jgi:uncharacterized protein